MNTTASIGALIAIAIAIAIAVSLCFILSSPPKSSYRNLFIDLSDNASISQHLFTLTRRPHVAGSEANAEAAAYVLSTLSSYNIPSHITSYDVLLTYPISRSLTLTRPPPEPPTVFKLNQEIYKGDPYAYVANQVLPTFHAYAKSATVSGPVVYVNYGRVHDFELLKEVLGVNVSGCVAIARYGKIYRGDIIENAYAAGALGVLIYTDRKDYGRGPKWFPEDEWMPPTGVQVGTVYGGAGDPTTPGWPSNTDEECERLSHDQVWNRDDVPHIPSLPISWSDGEEIMKSMRGPNVPSEDWQGGDDHAQVYRLGPGPGIIELSYKGSEVISTIENVIGIIEGAEEPDRFVILGNHRDAWTFGAVDPNSGTAALLEVAERLGKLQNQGWKPRRTIVFCNWDAEEYGLIGSTEWVEENREMIASRVVAYLNVDSAVYGAGFSASATPQLDDLLIQASKQVQDPDNSSRTIYETWVGSSNDPIIGRLGGGGSDYASFVQYAGVPSADMSFGEGYAVYHSMYDDYVWMKKFGDPMFQRHVAAANMWGIVALHLADDEILPFNYLSYAQELKKSAEELQSEVLDKGINLVPLFKSIKELGKASSKINNQIKVVKGKRSWASLWKRNHWEVRELNDRLMMAERAFTDRDGLSGRPWYKHLIYAPSKHNDYGSKSFPGIDDAIEEATNLNTTESWRVVQHEVWRVSRAIKHVSLVLNGELT